MVFTAKIPSDETKGFGINPRIPAARNEIPKTKDRFLLVIRFMTFLQMGCDYKFSATQ